MSIIRWWKNGDHPDDGVGEPRVDLMTMDTYLGIEGLVVGFYRHPDHPGERLHYRCHRMWNDHGWIDTPSGGLTVCPGDWVSSGIDGGWIVVRGDTPRTTNIL